MSSKNVIQLNSTLSRHGVRDVCSCQIEGGGANSQEGSFPKSGARVQSIQICEGMILHFKIHSSDQEECGSNFSLIYSLDVLFSQSSASKATNGPLIGGIY